MHDHTAATIEAAGGDLRDTLEQELENVAREGVREALQAAGIDVSASTVQRRGNPPSSGIV